MCVLNTTDKFIAIVIDVLLCEGSHLFVISFSFVASILLSSLSMHKVTDKSFICSIEDKNWVIL
jgi:hypothetical protein